MSFLARGESRGFSFLLLVTRESVGAVWREISIFSEKGSSGVGWEVQERDGDQLAFESRRAASKEKSFHASEISWTGVLSR